MAGVTAADLAQPSPTSPASDGAARADQMSLGSTCSVKSVKLRWLSGAHMR
jgi:hypothetical protein